MNRAFADENYRKEKLFEAWNDYLNEVHFQFSDGQFDKIYEGMATVLVVTKDHLELHLADGRKLQSITINSQISSHSLPNDLVYMILGQKNGKWWPLELVSVGSIIGKKGGAHLTMNPLLVEGKRE